MLFRKSLPVHARQISGLSDTLTPTNAATKRAAERAGMEDFYVIVPC